MATARIQLPPFPANSPPGSWAWVDWWKRLQDYIAEVTKVVQEGSLDNPSAVVGFVGLTDPIIVPWVAVANYCEFYVNIDLTAGPLSATSAFINLGPSGGNIGLPPMVGDGLLTIALFDEAGTPAIPPDPAIPYVQSLGVGYVTATGGDPVMYVPDFSVLGGPTRRIQIIGRYRTQ